MSRDLNDLHPFVRERVRRAVLEARQQGVDVLVYCTLRTPEEQDELYARGRTAPGRIVTNARAWMSWHNYGFAVDAVPMDGKHADWTPFRTSDDESSFVRTGDIGPLDTPWRVMVKAFLDNGFAWGGRFKMRDYPHFEFTFGLNLNEAKRIFAPGAA